MTALSRLLSALASDDDVDATLALSQIGFMLEKKTAARTAALLDAELKKLRGRARSQVVYVLAQYHRKRGDLASVRRHFKNKDAQVRASVLNALWEAGPTAEVGTGIVALALQGARDPAPNVRSEACRVFQNQNEHGDVSAAVDVLPALLTDAVAEVRGAAAYATGNLAKKKLALAKLVAPLARGVADEDEFVPNASAWALWQLSRHGFDIGAAVRALVRLLANPEGDWKEPHTRAAGALIHHAKKSSTAAALVKKAVTAQKLRPRGKIVERFLEQLAAVD